MLYDASFWVAVGFFLFLGLLGWLGVHRTVLGALDERAEAVKRELAEARRLREEAEKLLADYEAKRKAAEAEARGIVAAAEEEAKRIAADAEIKMADFIKRRTAQADQRIAQAEASAAAEVRAAAADAAARAAESILRGQVGGAAGEDLVRQGLKQLGKQLN
jgi:F-type H+-transporting ATPase subunit b